MRHIVQDTVRKLSRATHLLTTLSSSSISPFNTPKNMLVVFLAAAKEVKVLLEVSNHLQSSIIDYTISPHSNCSS